MPKLRANHSLIFAQNYILFIMQYRPHMLFSSEIGNFDYGEDHPMKPERISMVFDLLKGYDILNKFKLIQA